MSSGMNLEEAKEYAETMSYRKAINNIRYAKGIAYKKATMIKLCELAEIADRLDRKTENSSEKPNNCEPQYEMGMGTLKCDNCSECRSCLSVIAGSARTAGTAASLHPIPNMQRISELMTEAASRYLSRPHI